MIIRKDLPFGVALAQATHAAGESAQAVSIPPDTHAVVLAALDEQELLALETKLLKHGVDLVAIRELDPPYFNQLMAIGIKPQPRKKLKKLLSNLPLYK